ncbi:outer membrane beta-barrel protein [Duganella sp. BJB1802]|uniref:outer membrane beta-barrel protein n=1 Tax=Duganella sp. BJB1802 TaxID=2744575 RepID=UPI001593C090|nr:outer membrane beta-barrel protein [Duganella sp. BJB1802]NVD71129.1 outer membrane beta-barrel protein [Duganella sp. BJB1802]
MKQITVFAMIAALAAPLAVQAEGYYVGGNIGRAEQKADVGSASFKESATAYKLVGGFNYNKNFGAEIGYADLREVTVSGNGASISSKPSAFYVAATGTLPLNEQFSLFGKLGIAAAHEKLTATYGRFTDSGTDNRTTPYISVGAAFVLNKQVSFVAEYENFGKVAKDGSANIKADMFSAGVRYSF